MHFAPHNFGGGAAGMRFGPRSFGGGATTSFRPYRFGVGGVGGLANAGVGADVHGDDGAAGRRHRGDHLAVGVEQARPAPGVLEAIAGADVILLPPSNPVVSIGTILGGS